MGGSMCRWICDWLDVWVDLCVGGSEWEDVCVSGSVSGLCVGGSNYFFASFPFLENKCGHLTKALIYTFTYVSPDEFHKRHCYHIICIKCQFISLDNSATQKRFPHHIFAGLKSYL